MTDLTTDRAAKLDVTISVDVRPMQRQLRRAQWQIFKLVWRRRIRRWLHV